MSADTDHPVGMSHDALRVKDNPNVPHDFHRTTNNPTWENVMDAIESELRYQEKWEDNDIRRPLSIGDDILLLERLLTKTKDAWIYGGHNSRDPEKIKDSFRVLAAVAVAAMLRHGVRSRDDEVLDSTPTVEDRLAMLEHRHQSGE